MASDLAFALQLLALASALYLAARSRSRQAEGYLHAFLILAAWRTPAEGAPIVAQHLDLGSAGQDEGEGHGLTAQHLDLGSAGQGKTDSGGQNVIAKVGFRFGLQYNTNVTLI